MEPLDYPCDLADQEWQLLEPLPPPPKRRGRHIAYPRREIITPFVTYSATGRSWGMLLDDLSTGRVAFHCFGTWRRDSTWRGKHDARRSMLRQAQCRRAKPSAAVDDRGALAALHEVQ